MRVKTAVPNAVSGEFAKEAFDEVEPRTAGRGKCIWNRECLLSQALHPLVFMGGVVIGGDMGVEATRRLPVNLGKKAEPLDVGMATFSTVDQLAVQVIQHCETERSYRAVCSRGLWCERDRCPRAVPVGFAPVPEIGSFQRNTVREPSPAGRGNADYIPEFLLKSRIAGYREGPHLVRLQVVVLPNAMNTLMRDPNGTGHAQGGPALAAGRRFGHLGDHPSRWGPVE